MNYKTVLIKEWYEKRDTIRQEIEMYQEMLLDTIQHIEQNEIDYVDIKNKCEALYKDYEKHYEMLSTLR